jgi:membrane-bound lytic murein transglycosylase D
MAIRTRLRAAAVGFPLIFALGAVSQGAAEPFYRGDDEARAFEAASVVTPDVQPPIGDQVLTDFGSTPEPPPAEEADEIDPWAEAFAEGSRLPLVRFAPAAPEYPVVVNEQVQYFVDLFTGKRRELVTLWVNRSSKYLAMIRDVLRSRGLPEELAYTAMIESGFKPDAVSRVGAKGMWQFMAPTARRYGLRVDTWVDERYDPEKSTIAAAGYLKDLYAQFGSWALAQAAYNAGEVKILRAMKKTGSSDFWILADSKYLKRETKDFVPQIHAATVIGRDPDRYGFEFDDVEPAAFETVRVPGRTDLRRLAATSGIPFQTLRALNRVLVRGITPPGRAWDLRVPTGSADAVRTALAPRHRTPIRVAGSPKVTRAASRVDVHVVRPKDTVSSIAKQYGVSVSEVLKMNSLESQARIRPGDRLRVATRPSVERDGEGGFR